MSYGGFPYGGSPYGGETKSYTVLSATDVVAFGDSADLVQTALATDTVPVSDAESSSIDVVEIDDTAGASVGLLGLYETVYVSDRVYKNHGFARTATDTISISDIGTGTSGRAFASASDTVYVHDPTYAFAQGIDVVDVAVELAACGIVFLLGIETVVVIDSVTAEPDILAFIYQYAAEVGFVFNAYAHIYQVAAEVAVRRLVYGQMWPVGWGTLIGSRGMIAP